MAYPQSLGDDIGGRAAGPARSSPELIPSPDDVPLIAVTEFPVGAGYINVLAVGADGSVVIVACKLASNPEIRRHVIGQVFAYAGALWQLPFETFEHAFRSRGNQDLVAHPALTEEPGWDPDEFRRAVTATLASGSFRVVLAVDAITEELKRSVPYLNTHSSPDLDVVAMEVSRVRDGDLEVLMPSVYGEESVDVKSGSTRATNSWDEESFWDH